jgi:putative hemolysin
MLDVSSMATTETSTATEVVEAEELKESTTPTAPPVPNGPLNAGDMAAIEPLIDKLICEVEVAYRETREEAERRVHRWMVATGLAGNHWQWIGQVRRRLV